MNRRNTMLRQGVLIRQTVFVISLGCILSACSSASKETPKAQQTGFLQQLRNSSITIYPVVVVRETGISELDTTSASEFGDFFKAETNAAVTLSDQRMSSVTPWAAMAKGTWHEGADALKSHILKNPIQTDYAIMIAYVIPRGRAANVIHAFMANARGELIRRVRITRQNQVFVDAAPRNASDCTDLLMQVLSDRIRLIEAQQNR